MIRGWRAVGRQFASAGCRDRTLGPSLPGLTARTHTTPFSGLSRRRVESRVLRKAQSAPSGLHIREHISGGRHHASPPPQPRILQSRFPTKTFVAVVIISALVYYSGKVEISFDEPLHVRVNQHALPGGPSVLQCFSDVQQINEAMSLASTYRRPPYEMLEGIYDRFEEMVGGWMMEENEAQELDMPVTHGCRFGSNNPTEDSFSLGSSPGPGGQQWKYWGVYDGHAGHQTSLHLQWCLIPYVSRALSALSNNQKSSVTSTIMQTFVQLDNEIMTQAKTAGHWSPTASPNAMLALNPAFAGSCALLSAYDPETSKLSVACVGDSRAVLGRWDPASQTYICKPLSVDQTGFNASEKARILAEHPDEPDILDDKSGRLLGLAVTRAFGDHRLKWDNEFIKQLQYKFWGHAPRPQSKTPPYLTAEPVVTETDVQAIPSGQQSSSTRSDFMIMASDGLWDRISSEHAVECVQRWLEAKERGKGSVRADPQLQTYDSLAAVADRPDPSVTYDVEAGKEANWKATPEFFAIEDENAAVCLARNAMGGTRRSLAVTIWAASGTPQSRDLVDGK
ncbi:protein serine/threonine phosphatase 2C [Lophiostoma macrostomum CBS 122681]|uniref:Protein serine/threonine phosphatase 2C n=1 Tax=Lophiostoma macrostomum CBS 122681 TaxID=1314788 RepID=A0A6A6TV79_9PLEO|nr:protein serine/threonine phosphatase 2C [Lophiostoma macrostomum CBS 122681]